MQIDTLRVTRDSFCMEDDANAPHEHTTRISQPDTVEELVFGLYRQLRTFEREYSSTTWAVISKRPLAVISNKWDSPHILFRAVRRLEDYVLVRNTTAYLHFCSYQDQDPTTVYQVLERISFPYLRDVNT